MASDVDICNRALVALGEDTILNLSVTSKAGITCARLYPDLRDSLLSEHSWSFAIKRVALAPDATAPVWGFSAKFQLPSDSLRLLSILNNPDVKLEADFILSDESELFIRYIFQQTDTTKFSFLFIEALAALMASEMAIILTNDKKLRLDQSDIFEAKLKEARFNDSTQSTPDIIEAEAWIDSRR